MPARQAQPYPLSMFVNDPGAHPSGQFDRSVRGAVVHNHHVCVEVARNIRQHVLNGFLLVENRNDHGDPGWGCA